MLEFLMFSSMLFALLSSAFALEATSFDPFVDGSTFHGNWRGMISPPDFVHEYGTLVFRLDTFATSLPQWHYVQGLLLVRDGQYADQDVDLRFRLHGVYLPYSGEAFLFTHENWKSEPFLSFVSSHIAESNDNDNSDRNRNKEAQIFNNRNNSSNISSSPSGGTSIQDVVLALLSVQSNLFQTHTLKKSGSDKLLSKCDLFMHVHTSEEKQAKGEKYYSSSAPASSESSPMYIITASSTLSLPFNSSLTSLLPSSHAMNNSALSFSQLHLNVASGNLSSPQCGFELSLEASIEGTQYHFAKGTHYCYVGILIAMLQIYHTAKQMTHASSHSSASQVAVWTIYLQALLDAYIYFFHIIIAVVVEPIRNNFVEFAFFDFVAFSLVEMRFLFLLWKVQYPEIFASGGERMHREFGIRYARFYGSLLMGLFFMQWHFFLRCIVFLLSSFWVPQIVRNIRNDLKKPLLPSYIIIMSISRLFLPLYLWGCPANFFNLAPHPWLCGTLVFYILLQGAILLLQMVCGPRFMIPERYLPVKYKYHRAMPLQRIECKDGGISESEPCAICYNEFDSQMSRNAIMVTPCDHVFHTECLLKWMEQKMQCPTCRFEPLPVP